MKQFILAPLFVLFFSFAALANTGDTIKITGHNKVNMPWYGNYDDTTVFPPASKTFNKIIMHYTLGCASGGCSQWDYTTIIYMMQHTGIIDSSLALAPSFTVNGSTIDTFLYSTDTTWVTSFDTTTKTTDSVPSTLKLVREYSDSLTPYTQTDSMYVYPVGYWNYYYDTTGAKTDSAFVTGTQTLIVYLTHVYTPYEFLQPHEMGRVITPYAGYYPQTWTFDYVFDVTDYAPLLHDTVILRDFYSGYSSGFSVTLTFDMIEGTPPRQVQNIHPMFNGYWGYGSTSDPIDNHMPPDTFSLSSNETMAMLRFTPTGHGFAGADGCSEFCSKYYDVYINNYDIAEDYIWRNDCGMNPLLHQAGTWLYNRANWCPGAKGLRKDYEISSNYISPQQPLIVDIQMEPYTNPGGDPGYQMAGELFTYGSPSQQFDATIDQVIQPNNEGAYSRFNPVCADPEIVIKNLGAQPLTSLRIHYGFEGENNYDYLWSGDLAYGETQVVDLPNMVLNDSTPSHIFQVFTYLPNGHADGYPYNDTVRTYADFPPVYDSVIIFYLRTNEDSGENNWLLTDAAGDTMYFNDASHYHPNSLYRDTFHLPPGCYKFTLNDTGGDGLYFFADPGSGQGLARLATLNNTTLISFQPDFGSQLNQSFIVGSPTLPPGQSVVSGIEEKEIEPLFNVYPNPNNGNFTANIILSEVQPITIQVFNSIGALISTKSEEGFSYGTRQFNLSGQASGLYFIKLTTRSQSITRKIVLQK